MVQFILPAVAVGFLADRRFAWVPPVRNATLRGVDAFGSGAFGASRDGGSRMHLGLDIKAKPGQKVFAPIGGVVRKFSTNRGLLGVAIIDGNRTCKVIYVQGGLQNGGLVGKGDLLGYAQDIRPEYGNAITNHVHLETWVNGVAVNPETKLPLFTRLKFRL